MSDTTPDGAQDWRIERYQDETDPFSSLQWYVMRGNAVIATCEVEAHADRILSEHQRVDVYVRALASIVALPAAQELEAARQIARQALERDA